MKITSRLKTLKREPHKAFDKLPKFRYNKLYEAVSHPYFNKGKDPTTDIPGAPKGTEQVPDGLPGQKVPGKTGSVLLGSKSGTKPQPQRIAGREKRSDLRTYTLKPTGDVKVARPRGEFDLPQEESAIQKNLQAPQKLSEGKLPQPQAGKLPTPLDTNVLQVSRIQADTSDLRLKPETSIKGYTETPQIAKAIETTAKQVNESGIFQTINR